MFSKSTDGEVQQQGCSKEISVCVVLERVSADMLLGLVCEGGPTGREDGKRTVPLRGGAQCSPDLPPKDPSPQPSVVLEPSSLDLQGARS